MFRVAILGGGPAAAFAWRACLDSDITPEVYTDGITRISTPGAFWIYWLPKSVVAPVPERIHIGSLGTASMYSLKMWGQALPSSFPEAPETKIGYEPAASLFALWGSELTAYRKQKFQNVEQIAKVAKNYDLVFQTFPDPGASTQFLRPVYTCTFSEPDSRWNSVLYDGTTSRVLRTSVLFSRHSTECTECPEDCPRRDAKLSVVYKLDPRVTEHPSPATDNIALLGRFASRNRKFLAHQTYQETVDCLRTLTGYGKSS